MVILGFESPNHNYGFFFCFFCNACSGNLEPHFPHPHPHNQIISKFWDKFYFGPWNFFLFQNFCICFQYLLPLLNYTLNDKFATRTHTRWPGERHACPNKVKNMFATKYSCHLSHHSMSKIPLLYMLTR